MKKLVLLITFVSLGSNPALYSWPAWLGGAQKAVEDTCNHCNKPSLPPLAELTYSEEIVDNAVEGFWHDAPLIAGACVVGALGNVGRNYLTANNQNISKKLPAFKGMLGGAVCGFGGSLANTLYHTSGHIIKGTARENIENLILAFAAVAAGYIVFWPLGTKVIAPMLRGQSPVSKWWNKPTKKTFIKNLNKLVESRNEDAETAEENILVLLPESLKDTSGLAVKGLDNKPTLIENFVEKYNDQSCSADDLKQCVADIQSFFRTNKI